MECNVTTKHNPAFWARCCRDDEYCFVKVVSLSKPGYKKFPDVAARPEYFPSATVVLVSRLSCAAGEVSQVPPSARCPRSQIEDLAR